VVLSDIAIPGENGYWLLQEIRRLPDERLRALPVVAATAYGCEHSRARTLAAGFVEQLQKPADPEQLCRTVARVAGRWFRGAGSEAAVRRGDVRPRTLSEKVRSLDRRAKPLCELSQAPQIFASARMLSAVMATS
jgi:DNA-binding NarL/FixJ family response regulator